MIPLVSILVPVYNVEKYVAACFDSLLSQTMPDVEIIALNDGSTDNSRGIVEQYCNRDARIRLIDQDNRGLGAARNILLAHAIGKYVLFIDSDDYIMPETVEVLLHHAQQNEVEIVIYNGKAFYDYGATVTFAKKHYFPLDKKDEGVVRTGWEYIAQTGGKIQSVCLKMFNRDFLTQNNILFPEGVLGEDVDFFYRGMMSAQRVSYVDFVGYYRRYRPNSIVTIGSIKNIRDRINYFQTTAALADDIKISKTQYAEVLKKQFAQYACILWVLSMSRKQAEERKWLLADFKEQKIDAYVLQNKKGMIVFVIAIFISLPDFFNGFKRMVCFLIKTLFKSKSRLFQ